MPSIEDIQSDSEIGSENWINVGTGFMSPEDVIFINNGSVRRIRFRFRMISNNSFLPPIIIASVLKCFIRLPIKYQWTVNVKLNDLFLSDEGNPNGEISEFITWLKTSAEQTNCLVMRSIWEDMDNKEVIVEPPAIEKKYKNSLMGTWGGTMKLIIKEF